MKKSYIFIAVCIACLIIGFLVGRKTIDTKESVTLEHKESVSSIVRIPEPKETKPASPVYKYKTDTINNIIVQKVDTAQIIEDWIKNRNYNITLFDNDNGKLNIDASVQYNKLFDLQYTFTPIQKVITKQKTPVFTPFVGVSYNSLGYVSAGGGLFYHDLGIELRYITDFDKKGVDFGIKYKF